MIDRYSLPEMAAVWSERHKLDAWQQVEALVVEAWANLGVAPRKAAAAVRAAPPVEVAAWKAKEEVTGHDVAAFVDVLAESVAEGGEWVHYGLTSSDVLDTAQGMLMRDATNLLLTRTGGLFTVTKKKALEHRDTVMVGRTHGMWAEPTTFGLKLATWCFEIARAYQRLWEARDAVAVGKISGAVGTYAHLPPEIEEFVCGRLGLAVEPAAGQVVHRDRHAQLLSGIALTGASLERFATEIRHLHRSEVAEVEEAFGEEQKGSSAMPHKHNPIVAERITGLARLLRGYAHAGMENVALWHERDISHSSVERVVLPDACLLLDYSLAKMTELLDGLVVRADRMAANLEATGGLAFSQAVLLALIDQGVGRDEAYRVVQHNATQAREQGAHLSQLLAADPEITLSPTELAACFEPERFLSRSEVVFERLEQLEPSPG
ncbi:MAG: adenylosuccinate lyase [Acidimicrobiia bacterium]